LLEVEDDEDIIVMIQMLEQKLEYEVDKILLDEVLVLIVPVLILSLENFENELLTTQLMITHDDEGDGMEVVYREILMVEEVLITF
jgi:hypothetical protein